MAFDPNAYLARQYRLCARAKLRKAREAKSDGDRDAVSRLVLSIKRDVRLARQHQNRAAK